MDIERASVLARESGFEIVGALDVAALNFRQDVRDMCTPQMCPQGYGRSWSCPPAVPALETMRSEAASYAQGIIVQTVGKLEDSFDFETIVETTKVHAKAFMKLADKLTEELDNGLDGSDADCASNCDHCGGLNHSATKMLPLGAGACPRCATCTYPDSACCMPDKMITSMEASGLLVNQVCEENGLLYNHGEKTIAFTSCCLF